MITDLQKASLLKRLSAYILDVILLITLAVGIGWILSSAMHYDSYAELLEERSAAIEQQYGVELGIAQEEYEAMTQEQKTAFDEASKALSADQTALYAYNMMINQALIIVSISLMLSHMVLEFIVPLLLKNGQTIGKKCFSLGLIRADGVQVSNFSLFVRAILGKFTMETMAPLFILLLILLGSLGAVGMMVLIAFFLLQIALVLIRQDHGMIHDLIAGTVVVDIQSQMVFRTTDDLIAYKQRLHAEEVKKKSY